jgi:hypothetical protein
MARGHGSAKGVEGVLAMIQPNETTLRAVRMGMMGRSRHDTPTDAEMIHQIDDDLKIAPENWQRPLHELRDYYTAKIANLHRDH